MIPAESGWKGIVWNHILGAVATLTHLGYGALKVEDRGISHMPLAAVSELKMQPRIYVVFNAPSYDTGVSARTSPTCARWHTNRTINHCGIVYLKKQQHGNNPSAQQQKNG